MNTHPRAASFYRVVFSLGLAALLLVGVRTGAEAAIILKATLDSAQENNPANTSTATGFATFILANDGLSMTYTATIFGIDVTGSQTPLTTADNLMNAHIHCCAPPGTNAPVRWGFFGMPFNDTNPPDELVIPFATGVGGDFSGKWDEAEGQGGTMLSTWLPSILAGQSYINFHTVAFPGGEIRGQIILAAPEPGSLALLGIGALALMVPALRRRRT